MHQQDEASNEGVPFFSDRPIGLLDSFSVPKMESRLDCDFGSNLADSIRMRIRASKFVQIVMFETVS